MDQTVKKTIAALISFLVLAVAYYGNYLPMRKSQIYISTLRSLQSVRSLADFEKDLSVPLDFPSPIGQEELVRSSSNMIMNIIQENNNPQVISEVLDYYKSYYRPIIDRGRGMSFEQNLYILGKISEIAFVRTKEIKYFNAAKDYFSQGLRLGPRRPQFLYAMFDIYRMEGNVDGAKSTVDKILSQWPSDQKIRQLLGNFLSQMAAAKK